MTLTISRNFNLFTLLPVELYMTIACNLPVRDFKKWPLINKSFAGICENKTIEKTILLERIDQLKLSPPPKEADITLMRKIFRTALEVLSTLTIVKSPQVTHFLLNWLVANKHFNLFRWAVSESSKPIQCLDISLPKLGSDQLKQSNKARQKLTDFLPRLIGYEYISLPSSKPLEILIEGGSLISFMPTDMLDQVLSWVVRNRKKDLVKIIVEREDDFKSVSFSGLNLAFDEAVKARDLSIVEMLIQSSRFNEIDSVVLKHLGLYNNLSIESHSFPNVHDQFVEQVKKAINQRNQTLIV